jgi:hypothetical protein
VTTPEPIPAGLCQCGCGQPTKPQPYTDRNRGMVKGEPRRFIHGHSSHKGVTYLVDPDTGCWNWQGRTNGVGYGVLTRQRKAIYAHRYFYEQRYGAIGEGLQLDHLCRNRLCCNPDHLQPVTARENVRRGVGPSAENARKTHCVHGHPLSGDNLYVAPKSGKRQCQTCRLEAGRRRRAR